MKAWLLDGPGLVELLRLLEVEDPTPGDDEVVVHNASIGLNPVDWKLIESGHDGWSWPHIPGVDGAGTIIAVGDRARRWEIGARVAYHSDLARCGSFAELTAVPARALIPLPPGLSFDMAAALPCPGLTAWQALDKLPLKQGAAVLVTGASGAVGGYAVQLAARRGYVVHAVAAEQHHARVLGFGAATVTDHHVPDWREALRTRLPFGRVQAVIDVVSGKHAVSLVSLLDANGHLVCVQDRQETQPLPAFTKTISLHEVGLGAMHGHGTIRAWGNLTAAGEWMAESIRRGEIDPQIAEVHSFEGLPEALSKVKARSAAGQHVVSFTR